MQAPRASEIGVGWPSISCSLASISAPGNTTPVEGLSSATSLRFFDSDVLVLVEMITALLDPVRSLTGIAVVEPSGVTLRTTRGS